MQYFMDKSIQLQRLRRIDINRSVYSATGTAAGYPTSWQEPSPDKLQFYNGQIGDMFVCFVDILCPVKEADKVIRDGVKYSVVDLKTMDFGAFQYKKIVISKDDA